MGRRFALLVCVLAACDEGGDGGSFDTTTTPSTKKTGGFSAELSKETGSGSDGKTVAVADPKAGDGSAKAGDGSAKAGDPKPGDAKPAEGSGDAKAGSGVDAKAGDTKAGDVKAGDTKVDPKAGDTKVDPKAGDTKVDPKASDTKVDPKAGDTKVVDAGKPGPPPIDTAKPRVYVKPPADIAAIKLSLLPNWDRDVGDPGTISLVVKVPGTDKTQVFAFRYGYEDPKAPSDREAYKKWLADQGILKAPATGVLVDRQRGSSWYLEGVDGSGSQVFRNVVVYGGKKLICGGSLYRDAVHNTLGDIRDKTVLQAKEICGDLGL